MTPEQLERKRKYIREWQERNREKIRADARAKYAANPSLFREKAKLWRKHYRENGPATAPTAKRCSTCRLVKKIDEFPKNSTNPDGKCSHCRKCSALNGSKWRTENAERHKKAWKAYNRRPEVRARDRLRPRQPRTKEQIREANKRWREKHPGVAARLTKAWHKRKYKEDPIYRFTIKIKSKIRLILSGLRKSAPTEILLGCKVTELRKWLESKWTEGMSWDNYGSGWHIDHKIPIAAFNLADPDQQKLCFHYTNLQPLWATDNLAKSDRLDWTPHETH